MRRFSETTGSTNATTSRSRSRRITTLTWTTTHQSRHGNNNNNKIDNNSCNGVRRPNLRDIFRGRTSWKIGKTATIKKRKRWRVVSCERQRQRYGWRVKSCGECNERGRTKRILMRTRTTRRTKYPRAKRNRGRRNEPLSRLRPGDCTTTKGRRNSWD